MDSSKTYSSGNRMAWELFEGLRRLCTRISKYSPELERNEIRQDTALAVILSVQCVEVFLNIYFRVLVSEEEYKEAFQVISQDLKNRNVGITHKIKKWPQLVFGENLDLGRGIGQKFIDIINLRHDLMHFKSSFETIELPVHGVADTTKYDSLTSEFAKEVLSTSEEVVAEFFSLRGVSSEQIPHSMHAWTGKLPV